MKNHIKNPYKRHYDSQRVIDGYNMAYTNHLMLNGLYPEAPSFREHVWLEKCMKKRWNGTYKTILNFLPDGVFAKILMYLRMSRKERRNNPDLKKIYMLSMKIAEQRMELASMKKLLREEVKFDEHNHYIED